MTPTSETKPDFWHSRKRWIAIAMLLVIVFIIYRVYFTGAMADLPSAVVQQGEFVIDLNETGRLRAENSETVTSPPVRIPLQIVFLIPEGTVVEKGDTLIQFDITELEQRLDEYRAELDITKSTKRRDLASMQSHMASLHSAVANSRASYRLAELRLEQMKFEAEVRIEEGKLNLLQANLSLEQAETQVLAQEQIDSADVRSLELKIRQAEIDIEKAVREIDKLTVTAPAPGLVVYKEMWKGGALTKVKIGDTPWRGMALLELPDLSVMLVETSVSEVDVSKIRLGQKVEINLDAYPDPVFHGEIVDLANMARSDQNQGEAKVFDILIRISEFDPLLKPGMSATARIIVNRIPDQTWIPIESVFYKAGKPVVYTRSGGSWKLREIELGARNDNFVIVEVDLLAGEIISLVDPTTDLETELKEPQDSKNDQQAQNSGNKPKNQKITVRSRRNH